MTTKKLGTAITIGELRKLIKKYPGSTHFGFRNQPVQSLYESKNGRNIYISFQ